MVRPYVFASAAISTFALALTSVIALAQMDKFDFGKREYALHCAACHGLTGTGDGPYKQTRKRPGDLTALSKTNRGAFPYQRVWAVIDGREEIEAHGTRDMPIGGSYYRSTDEQVSGGAHIAESDVRMRIMALVDYIQRLQAR